MVSVAKDAASELETSEFALAQALGAWVFYHWPTGPGRSVTGYAIGRVTLSFDRQGDWQSAGVRKEGYSLGSVAAVLGYLFGGEESSHSSAVQLQVELDVQMVVPSGGTVSAVEVLLEA